jgi:hypothetical protein
MFVLLGFAALVIDVGVMHNVRRDLQRAADSAALAGASTYVTDDMMRVRMDSGTMSSVASVISQRVIEFGRKNATIGSPQTNIGRSDIETGWVNPHSLSSPINNNPHPRDFNVVSVKTRRDEGMNGSVPLFFAWIFGKTSTDMYAYAAAAFDDHFAGVRIMRPGTSILPFTIHEDAFEQEMAQGSDQYAYNEPGVSSGSDGIIEIRLFPYPLSGSGYEEGDGNFGFLNVGNHSEGASVEKEQILQGITKDQAIEEFGTNELTFFDYDGNPTTYQVDGSPGLTVTVQTEIEQRIGDVVGFFLHNNVVESGSNAIYTITRVVYGRVMDVRLTGALQNKYLYVQPASYNGSDIIIHENAPSSNGLTGRLVLVR